jgi:RNA polymerase sigma-70 factor (ECF subfamily)
VPGEDFDDFYRATARRVVRYVYALTGDQAEAQDLTQEAYIRAWRHWSRIGDFEHAEAWVRLVAGRLATDRWRRLRRRKTIEAASAPPQPAGPPSEDTVLLARALKILPINQRQAVCLYYLLDLPIADIAHELDVPAGTVKSWLSRARAALAEYLSRTPSTTLRKEGNGVR